ncbi:hypothetical protein F5J12DRAFT_403083 [Pisolithus orientalis]|uniref:uncharacterized protein n=1 Tax=Pisolithus orientalis TaxID=936130 RepID=UPI0022255196|nr:uncharacterized protein F5J12DRAFT_403083 [Pisolithus orientalis]KAI5995280.1 hypothetical protein F5J12DRAFT_403083 [Pisolithus orientalis]
MQLSNSHWQPSSSGIQTCYFEAAAHIPPRIDENYRLGPRRPTDINRQLDEISRDLAYVDTLLAELWLLLLRYKQTSVYHFGDFLPSKKTSDLASAYHSQPINDTCPQPADFQPGNEELECLWLSEDSDGPCSHRFKNRKDFIDHLNRSHEANGTAKRKIPCRWLLGPHDLSVCEREVRRAGFSRHIDVHLKTTFACPHPGCQKRYSRHDVLQKHLKVHTD